MKQIVTISILVNQFYLFLWCQLIHITQFQIYILFLVATCHFISFHLWALNGWCSDASLHRFNLFCFTAKTCYSNRPLIFHDLVDLFYVVVFLSLNSPISYGFEFHSEMVTFISRCEMVLIVWKCIFISGSRKSGKKIGLNVQNWCDHFKVKYRYRFTNSLNSCAPSKSVLTEFGNVFVTTVRSRLPGAFSVHIFECSEFSFINLYL